MTAAAYVYHPNIMGADRLSVEKVAHADGATRLHLKFDANPYGMTTVVFLPGGPEWHAYVNALQAAINAVPTPAEAPAAQLGVGIGRAA